MKKSKQIGKTEVRVILTAQKFGVITGTVLIQC